MMARVVSLAVLGCVLAACEPPPVLTFSSRGEWHLFPTSSGPNQSLVIDTPEAPSSFRVVWQSSPPSPGNFRRNGVLTADGIAAIDAAVTTVEDGWDGPYSDECADCWSTTSFSFRDETGATVGVELGSTPAELTPLDQLIRDVRQETMECGPYVLTEPQPEPCYPLRI